MNAIILIIVLNYRRVNKAVIGHADRAPAINAPITANVYIFNAISTRAVIVYSRLEKQNVPPASRQLSKNDQARCRGANRPDDVFSSSPPEFSPLPTTYPRRKEYIKRFDQRIKSQAPSVVKQ